MKCAKRGLALLLSVAFLVSLLVVPAYADEESAVLKISTPEEFLEFSQMCRYDAYSDGLTVTLLNDIDMTGMGFEDVPIFLGTFNGGGYTISGIENSLEMDNQGLFRYVAEGALISNLTVESTVNTQHNIIGGIAAKNYGTIQSCRYVGVVSGIDTIGGIAGENYGVISNCTVTGGVFGESQVGGIAGVNTGSIIRCYNYAEVNTEISEFEFTVEDTLVSTINPSSDTIDIAHIGGIAGNSTGIIQNCTNRGDVGYPHVGYNVGGIVGIQSGYVTGCTNYGTVQGRKEVGGIVGQFEPYVDTLYSTSKLQSLREELAVLSDLTSQFTGDANESNVLVGDSMTQLGDSVDESKTHVESLIDQTEDMVNANVDSVNQISVTVADTIDRLVPMTESFEPIIDAVSNSMTSMEEAADYFAQASDELDAVEGILEEMADYLEVSSDNMDDALAEIEDAISVIENADNLEDLGEEIQALGSHLESASQSLQNANTYLGNAMDIAEDYLSELSADLEGAQMELTALSDALEELTAQLESSDMTGVPDALAEVATSLSDLLGELESLENFGDTSDAMFAQLDLAQGSMDSALNSIESAMDNVSDIGDEVEDIAQTIQKVAGYLGDALDEFAVAKKYFDLAMEAAEELIDVFDDTNDALGNGLDSLSDGFGYLETATEGLETTHGLVSDLVEDLSGQDEIIFTQFDDTYEATRDQLSDSLTQMSESMSQLNSNLTLSADVLIADLEVVNLQFAVVLDLMVEIIQDTAAFEEITFVEDVSTMDTSDIYAGKVVDCQNSATVEGDINVGGIAGAISFEVAFDMEDDLTSGLDKTQTATNQGIAIIESCTNTGDVTAKKDSVGGILGYQDFGLVQSCTAGAIVESTEGSYVGGIVGQSTGYIRSCFSKTTLSGTQFVGGIVGSGYDVQGCYSLSAVSATNGGIGGIVGDLDSSGALKNNYFVSNTLGGLDGISFAGQAESISYEDLLLVEGLPDMFQTMTISFYVEDTAVGKVSVEFGGAIDSSEFPEIPQRVGYYSHWEDFETENITSDLKIQGDYYLLLTTIGGVKNQDGVATVLVDGTFTDEDILMTTETLNPQEGILASYTLWVEGDNTAITAIRYLMPEDGVTIQLEQDGQWVDVETTEDGKYLIIPVDTSGTVQFQVLEPEMDATPVIILGAIVAGLLVLRGAVLVVKKKRKQPVAI